MKNQEFIEKLNKFGIKTTIYTLKRWAKQGIIPPYKIKIQKKKKRRHGRPKKGEEQKTEEETKYGRYIDWSKNALEEVVAFYALRDSGIAKQKNITAEKVAEIKNTARLLFNSKKIFFESSSEFTSKFTIVTPPRRIFDAQELEMTVKENKLNNLAVTWIAARERARWCMKDHPEEERARLCVKNPQRVKVILDWYYEPPDYDHSYDQTAHRSWLAPPITMTEYHDRIMSVKTKPFDEIRRGVDQVIDDAIDNIDDEEEREQIRIERETSRLTRGKPRLEPSESDRDELVVFLHSHRELIERL